MKKALLGILISLFTGTMTLTMQSCDDGETYAEMKEKERDAISRFIKGNDITGPISVISEATFLANDTTTDVSKNEYVLFSDDGIYMQIVQRGTGKSMEEMAKEQTDETTTKSILCRFTEYDIQSAETMSTNYYEPRPDKMQCHYELFSRAYTASFTEGIMLAYYGGMVPTGWLKPLDYIRLSRSTATTSRAKVRLIVPHSSGTGNASQYVLPYYYEITYQLGN